MLWSDFLPYEFNYDGEGNLTVNETNYWFASETGTLFTLIPGVIFLLFSPFLFFVFGLVFFLFWGVLLFSFIVGFWPVFKQVRNGKRLYFFDAKRKEFLIDGRPICSFSDISSLQFLVTYAPDSNGNSVLKYFCVLQSGGKDLLRLDTLRDGFIASIITDEISRATGIDYHFMGSGDLDPINKFMDRVELIEYNKYVLAKKEFDIDLAKFHGYTDAELKQIISREFFIRGTAFKAAKTTLRRRKKKKSVTPVVNAQNQSSNIG